MDVEQNTPPSIGQRLSAIEERLDRVTQQVDRVTQQVDRVTQQVDRLAQRLEEAIGYFAVRSNRVADSQSIYLGDNTAVTFLEDGTRILVDTKSLDIGLHLLTLGRWEPPYTTLFSRLVRPGDTVFDLGANHGVYALMAARLVGAAGRVHAFEPNPRLAQLVDMSLHINGFAEWAQVHRVAASDRAGVARLFFTDSYSGGGSLSGTETQSDATGVSKHGVDCRLVPLDTLFPDPAMRLDVIKMDVEGHEGPALRGMRHLLERSPDVRIMMEFGPQMMQGSGMAAPEVVAFLEALGLSAWTIDHDGGITPVPWADLAAQTTGLQNILAARHAPF